MGYSNNPESRLRHQLIKDPEMPCSLLRTVPIASGQMAIGLEKALHCKLRKDHPEAVVDPQVYQQSIRVKSEIYDASLTQTILNELDAIAVRGAIAAS